MKAKTEEHDRCWGGSLHSKERMFIDHLWQKLGVNPQHEVAALIEGRLIFAALRDYTDRLAELRRAAEGVKV